MEKAPNSVRRILENLGYRAVRFVEAESWKSLDEINGKLGTTDDTQVTKAGVRGQYAILREAETGKYLATAREKSPVPTGTGSDGTEDPPDDLKLEVLKSQMRLPNTQAAAYLLAKAHMEGRDDIDHKTLVTTANLTVLKAWAEGLGLSDLDSVAFRTVENAEELALQIEGQNSSVSVPLVGRSFSLKEPWDGKYSISSVSGRVGA